MKNVIVKVCMFAASIAGFILFTSSAFAGNVDGAVSSYSKTAHISGDGVAMYSTDSDCPLDYGLIILKLTSGNLRGCLYTTAADPVNDIDISWTGTYSERGTETFVGCYYDDFDGLMGCGTFNTTFFFSGKFDGGAEIFGRCQHPIVKGEGTGDFEGIIGRIDFKDVDPATGGLEYRGHIRLPE